VGENKKKTLEARNMKEKKTKKFKEELYELARSNVGGSICIECFQKQQKFTYIEFDARDRIIHIERLF
jgi:hypothetical protein